MTTKENIERKRGDTRAIIFIVKDADDNVVDISSWTALKFTIDTLKAPEDDATNVFQLSGSFVTDGTDGKVGFSPPGTTDIGGYFYDAQALDSMSGKVTIAEGKYKLTQDITKV